jgi:hypothetical protein
VLPFSHEQFIAVFAIYNEAIWPAQIFAYGLGLLVLAATVGQRGLARSIPCVALAAMWAWTGTAYHWLHFVQINPAAWLFGIMFVLEAVILGTVAPRISFARRYGPRRLLGIGLIVYSMLLYPLVGILAGYQPASLPWFGVTPCPLVLFTLGILLLSAGARWWVWVVPLAWSLIGGTAAWLLGIAQDWPLLLSGPAVVLALWQERARS